MIKIFIFLVMLSIPTFLIYLNLNHPAVKGRYLFTTFALFLMVERIWETFYTSREKNIFRFQGDWTMITTSSMYLVLCLLIIFEFFCIAHIKSYIFTLCGALIFILAGALRFWAIKKLGNQWAVHLVNKLESNMKPKLVKSGPYHYIRHPIYLGIILELIGIALIANAFYSLIFIFFVNVPLYIIRAIYEESLSLKNFGKEYETYRNKVPFMIPFKLCKRKGLEIDG